jgi:hypothetical protein
MYILLCSSFQHLHSITQNIYVSQGKDQSFYNNLIQFVNLVLHESCLHYADLILCFVKMT